MSAILLVGLVIASSFDCFCSNSRWILILRGESWRNSSSDSAFGEIEGLIWACFLDDFRGK